MKRTLRAFAVLVVFLVAASGLFAWSFDQVDSENGEAGPFRAVLEANGRIWHALYSPTRTTRGRPIAPGRKPRPNGDIGIESPIDVARWKMEVSPESAPTSDAETATSPASKSFSVTMAELRALPRTDTSAEFRCIEGWSEPITYAGVKFSDFAAYFKLDTSLPFVGMRTPDGKYYVSIDMDSMMHSQTLLAYEMNGQPLSPENGAPLRLIIPVKYGIKHIKRIGSLYLSRTRPPDYWAEQGYDWFAGL